MMTKHSNPGSSTLDNIAKRQRAGLTLDMLFAAMVALVMVISLAGFRAAGTDTSSVEIIPTAEARATLPSGVGTGCVADQSLWTDESC